jgi:hypothetical protein
MAKPRYIDPAAIDMAGDQPSGLSVKPPFAFQGVTCRAFPLRANMARLTQFCNSYLNMDIPPEIVYFRPALPYVYLMVLNYGSMAPSAVQAQNFGWVAQNEVTFLVPLERWRRDTRTGKPVFVGWANVSPFIFVDSQISLATGREVYGWPKVLAEIDADIPTWTTNPRSPSRLFDLSIPMFRHVYAGEAETQQVLISIDCDPSPAFAQFPFDISNPWSPLTAIPTAVRNSLSLMGEAADLLLGQRVRGFTTDRDARSLLEMGLKAGSYIARLMPEMLYPSWDRRDWDHTEEERHREPPVPRLFNDSVTLKQFRDPGDPSRACYQALVRSRMGVDRVNKCGLLSDLSLLGGDPSGGYTIRIHRHTAQPIVESLGIMVGAAERGTHSEVAILKPVLPFWTDVDLFYDKGDVICSRTNFGRKGNSRWVAEPQHAGHRHSRHRRHHGHNDHLDQWPLDEIQNRPDHFVRDPIPYNTAQGAATQAVAGPFHFPDVTVQVYPLLADQTKLDKFIEGYLNDPLAGSGYRFKTFGSYVYLMVSVCGDQSGAMWSDSNNIGRWADREVTFCIPVKWYEGDKLISAGMIEPFVYANNGRAVTTEREVNGRPSVYATIDSPKDVWLSPTGPGEHRQLLHMETEMFPALGLGQKAQLGTLLEIDERDVLPESDTVGWTKVTETWGPELLADLWRKTNLASDPSVSNATALALEILVHGEPINRLSLKQYPDAEDVEEACYQALVNTQRSITHIYEIREILDPVHVRLHRVAGLPIADVLGLKIKSVDSAKGNVVDVIQPIRPFWMHIAVKEQLGRVIWVVNGVALKKDVAAGLTRVRRSVPPSELLVWREKGHWLWTERANLLREGVKFNNQDQRRLGLKGQANDWLRKSLQYELAWIRSTLELDNLQFEELRKQLSRSDRQLNRDDCKSLNILMQTRSISDYCAAASVDSLTALIDAIIKAQADLAQGDLPQPDFFKDMYWRSDYIRSNPLDPKDGTPPENAASRLIEGLKILHNQLYYQFENIGEELKKNNIELVGDQKSFQDRLETIRPKIQGCVDALLSFSPKMYRAVQLSTNLGFRLKSLLFGGGGLGNFALIGAGDEIFKRTAYRALGHDNEMIFEMLPDLSGLRNPLVEASTIVEEIMDLVTGWVNIELFQRLTWQEAMGTIGELEELQLVLGNILNKGLENRDGRWNNWEEQILHEQHTTQTSNALKREEPSQRIRIESAMNEWAERHGLERSFDHRFGDTWSVPPSG